jgi:hypothetical protein
LASGFARQNAKVDKEASLRGGLAGLDQLRGLHAEGGGDLVDAGRVDASATLGFRDAVLGNPSTGREPFNGKDPRR